MEEVESIEKIIRWYETTPHPDLENLMRAAKKLSCRMMSLAIMTGNEGRQFRSDYIVRKLSFSRAFVERKKEGTVAAAEHLAELDTEEQRKQEAESESNFEAYKMIWKAADNVLSRMSQEIAEMRKEKDKANYLGNVGA
jgi:hypothetical protein